MTSTLKSTLLAGAAFVMSSAVPVAGWGDCESPAGRFVSVTGTVDVKSGGADGWTRGGLDVALCEGDSIRVGERSRAAVALINEAVLRIDQNTTIRLVDITPREQESSLLDMLRGAFQAFSRRPRFLEVSTPYLNGSVEGTEFVVRTDSDSTSITVFEGVVVAANQRGRLAVESGQSTRAARDESPRPRVVARPRELVQWALYYPPLIAAEGLAARSPELEAAARCVSAGDTACAFAELERVAGPRRGADHFLLRASLLLAVGRVDEARMAIDGALAGKAAAAEAYALRAVIDVAQNRPSSALENGRRAVALDPDSAAARIALSYALQSTFALEDARAQLLAAVAHDPDDGLALARLAELDLMLGLRDDALERARAAEIMSPRLSRTALVSGFSALAAFRTEEAVAAFQRAVVLDSADPLAHLGLGLAKIGRGELSAGRAGIEAAVALDSSSALLRAYLGKAYFEEERGPLDARQLAIAKELDPRDPTAYLYDGIRRQTENDPVGALAAIRESIERNDSRAVYRSRLLLDKDRAARGTSLARAYDDLGFPQLGVVESAKSLAVDPSNASAHRFLSDSYRGVRRTEISRVSELLQAQLLQDVNINPVQPSVSETNLNIVSVGGPAQAGFNEFTPLFQRNDAQLNVTALAGNNDTVGSEAVVSGLHDRLSYSVGAFTYDTDGWRDNNRLDQDLVNVYLQGAVSTSLNVQAELSRRRSKEGDLQLNFDPDDFLRDFTLTSERESLRLGLRYAPTPSSSFLLSYIDSDSERRQVSRQALDPFTDAALDSRGDTEGYQVEGQYIFQQDRFNLVAGAAYNDSDLVADELFELALSGPAPIVLFSDRSVVEDELRHKRGYAYGNIRRPGGVTWTVGASYDDFEQEPIKETSFNPKLGVQWQATDQLLFRAAAFKVLKPSLVNNRTVEPTQVAGFNQFFDDLRGTESWRYGLAVDGEISPRLAVGAELSWRELREANIELSVQTGMETPFHEDQDEQLHRLYAYWTPTDRLGVGVSFSYDRYQAEEGTNTLFGNRPKEITTMTLPVTVTWFDPGGFFSALGTTYVDQDVERSVGAPFAEGHDRFFLIDVAVGYRFAKRRGIASIGVKNLFNEDFRYQDDSFREAAEEPSRGPWFPDRFILANVSLSF